MVYPALTDNFNLAALNANFLELYNQINVKQSYTPTATNLGTVWMHAAIVKSGIGRYKLDAACGNWTANTIYTICTLSAQYRPSIEVTKTVLFSRDNTLIGYMWIRTNGNVEIQPKINMTNQVIRIDETYVI